MLFNFHAWSFLYRGDHCTSSSALFEDLPWKSPITICRENLPWSFAARTCRRSLPWFLPKAICLCKKILFLKEQRHPQSSLFSSIRKRYFTILIDYINKVLTKYFKRSCWTPPQGFFFNKCLWIFQIFYSGQYIQYGNTSRTIHLHYIRLSWHGKKQSSTTILSELKFIYAIPPHQFTFTNKVTHQHISTCPK